MPQPPPKMLAQPIALLGTGSDVGKSLLATALLRILRQEGFAVAPFKAQNMSNNSHVTAQGLEMGRAQAVQARAAGLEPEANMNPILLKPSGEQTSQIILQGKVVGQLKAGDFLTHRHPFLKIALEAYHDLARRFELIVIEGAGSLAEVNLRQRDIANLGLARELKAPVVMIADIDRGGVFAQIVGSLEVLEAADRALIKGILINRFRGDIALFKEGKRWLEERTGLPILGIIPYFSDLRIPAEDAVTLDRLTDPPPPKGEKRAIAVLRLPRISNFTDFDPLFNLPGVECHYLSRPRSLTPYDLLILPGSKATLADLAWLKKQGWAELILEFQAQKKPIFGICGGLQMLGQEILDPEGLESTLHSAQGLGLLPLTTTLLPHKTLRQVRAKDLASQSLLWGYEIHQGQSRCLRPLAPLFAVGSGAEGFVDAQGQVMGSYLHGLFESAEFLQALLRRLWGGTVDLGAPYPDPYDQLADQVRPHLDLKAFKRVLQAQG